MSTAIYKKGQGYWTRQMSTIAGGVMILLGAMWFSDFFKNVGWFEMDAIYFRAIAGVLWVSVLGFFLYYFIWLKPRSVDFLVATESEMKKVNWSSRREVVGSTIVVIALSAGIAGFCKVWDPVFVTFFSAIKVLDTPS